ncbi:hypothetical protein [Bacillus cereus]|nr:hypothetical protein [Bacillus cereus]EOO44195.1 hypothetical protein ICK_06452 [Bacillus cereus BAG1X2-2]EOP00406.1 hypothetical protein ICO_06362 [Bacillus cereus BAG2O-1]
MDSWELAVKILAKIEDNLKCDKDDLTEEVYEVINKYREEY